MLETLATIGIAAAFLVAAVFLGGPLALLTRRSAEGIAALVLDAAAWGLVVGVVAATATIWLGVGGAAASALAWTAGAVVAARTARAHPPVPGRASARTWWLLALGAVIVAVAVALRSQEVNFLPWVGDMGAYVNWANEFARSGEFAASWPPGFPVLLGLSSWAFGSIHTTAVVSAFGLVLVGAAGRTVLRISGSRPAAFAAAAVLAVQPHAVWFGTFPSSEALSAPLFVVWVAALAETLKAERARLVPLLIGQGLVVAALSFVRGSGTLLVLPVAALVVASLVVPDWRILRRRALATLGATVIGAGVGYWYGLLEIRSYFVSSQIEGILPDALVAALESAGVLDFGPLPVLGVVGAAGGAFLAAWRLRSAPPAVTRWPSIVGVLLAAGLTVGTVACFAVGAMTGAILWRLGILYLVGAIVAFALLPRRRQIDRDLLGVLLATTALMFIALHTVRLGFERGHSFYLYWDRYLFSEVLPVLVIVASLLIPRAAQALTGLRGRLAVAATVLAVAVGSVPSLALQVQGTEMEGAYGLTRDLAPWADGSPALWSSTSGAEIAEWGFPNTWMAFAVPLRRTFDVDLVNASQRQPNFGPDEVLDPTSIAAYAGCRSSGDVVIYEVRLTGQRLDARLAASGWSVEHVAAVSGTVSVLHQPATAWTRVDFVIDVWRVSVPASEVLTCADSPSVAPPLRG